MAEELRGAPVAKALTERLAERTSELRARGVVPTLAFVRVGERPDDMSYQRAAEKRCAKAGIETTLVALDADCSQDELERALRAVSADEDIHGCLLFRPLPAHLDEAAAAAALDPAKDVDGITAGSLYGVFAARPVGFAPCTAAAVMAGLDHCGVALDGARVAVVGRSLVVGKPLAMLLAARNATVTLCHSHTRDLADVVREADIVVSAMGKAGALGARCFRPGQTAIDVGMNWSEEAGRFVGDIAPEAAEIVDALTPVPGGVGAITTAVLAEHVVAAAERTLS